MHHDMDVVSHDQRSRVLGVGRISANLTRLLQLAIAIDFAFGLLHRAALVLRMIGIKLRILINATRSDVS